MSKKGGGRGAGRGRNTLAIARGRLRTGDVLFQKVRVLHARELDREAGVDMAHDAAGDLSERDQVPTSGRCSQAIAAPDNDMSTMRHMIALPSGRIIVERGLRGTMRS